MRLYTEQYSSPKANAQRNLCGRTHYVDDETLRWHKSRILSARFAAGGLLFAIVTSDALDMHNTRRGYRYVIFDIFGTVLKCPNLEDAFKTSARARKALWAALKAIDAKAHTLAAAGKAAVYYAEEIERLKETIAALEEIEPTCADPARKGD